MDFPNNPRASYCQPYQSNTALKRYNNISRKNKTKHLRISYTSGALKSLVQMIASLADSQHRDEKHLKEATCTRQTRAVFSAPRCNSTARETYIGHPCSPPVHQPTALHEERCRTQSACGFTQLHCALSFHRSHCPFLPTFQLPGSCGLTRNLPKVPFISLQQLLLTHGYSRRIVRVSWQRLYNSHSQLGRFSNIRGSCISQGCGFLLCAGGGLALMLPVTASENAAAPGLLCHCCLPPGRHRPAAASLLQRSLCNTWGISDLRFLPPLFSLKNYRV